MGSSFRWNDEVGVEGVTAWVPAFAGMTGNPEATVAERRQLPKQNLDGFQLSLE